MNLHGLFSTRSESRLAKTRAYCSAMDRWDARYRSGETGPTHPAPIIVEAVNLLPAGRALDLACGAGRNSLHLAHHGWSVVAIDASAAAIEIVRKLDPRIETMLLDIEREALPFPAESFNLICIINFLHRPLFNEAKRLVKPGGLIAAAIHTSRSTMNPKYTVAIGELRGYFRDWEILIDREDQIAEIVARKPA